MRKKPFQRSAWLGLVFILLGTMSNSATASPKTAALINCTRPNAGSTAVLRLKGAIDALFELGWCRASDRTRLGPGSDGLYPGRLVATPLPEWKPIRRSLRAASRPRSILMSDAALPPNRYFRHGALGRCPRMRFQAGCGHASGVLGLKLMSSGPQDSYFRDIPEPNVNLAVHTAPVAGPLS
jgi:hypothetical protein